MLYLSQMLGLPVMDADGAELGKVSELAIQTGEVFPRVTSLAFKGPGKVPFMISGRKYFDDFDEEKGMLASQFANGLILPILLAFVAIISSDKRIMGEYRQSTVGRVLLWATMGIVALLTIILLVMQVLGL